MAVTEKSQPRQIGDAHPVLISSPGMLPLSCHVQGTSHGHAGTPHAASCQGEWMCGALLLQSARFEVAAPFPFAAISLDSSPFSSNQLLFRACGPCPGNAMSPSPSVLLIIIAIPILIPLDIYCPQLAHKAKASPVGLVCAAHFELSFFLPCSPSPAQPSSIIIPPPGCWLIFPCGTFFLICSLVWHAI